MNRINEKKFSSSWYPSILFAKTGMAIKYPPQCGGFLFRLSIRLLESSENVRGYGKTVAGNELKITDGQYCYGMLCF